MGSLIPPELSLDSRFSSKPYVHRNIGEFIAEVSRIHTASEKILKLEDYVNRLQDEMKKIDAFKRELPLCMLLLSDAIVTMKEELAQCKKSNVEPVLEEFIPLKKSCTDEKDDKVESSKENNISSRDKMNWMSSVQLWNSDNHTNCPSTDFSNNKPILKLDKNKQVMEEEINRPAMDNLFQSSKSRTVLRAFVPFKGCANFPVMTVGKEDSDELPVPGLSLCTPEINNSREEISCIGFGPKFSSSRSVSSPPTNVEANLKAAQQQSARKQRRCWSPELHRRFVNALQQLGGAQAATPKQIRELMQVDGLTNDEVKSHLQKYRLHTRRVTTKASTSQPVGLWMSQEQCGESLKHSNSQSASPEGPLQLAGSCHGGDSIEDEDD
ncbi:UNVERIFIED_CONTAM: Myb family transcription factor EFM [Sesamum latifolium]|uniref:Myb family transcription factor EFM n=1 Tax=Sesamum latifolium TaxID=2727402 RepID=A0AAW2V066_9LAMI